MTMEINALLRQAKEEKRRNTLTATVPDEIDSEVEGQLCGLLHLLQPFATLTDALQGDGVTSSLAIPCFIQAISGKVVSQKSA